MKLKDKNKEEKELEKCCCGDECQCGENCECGDECNCGSECSETCECGECQCQEGEECICGENCECGNSIENVLKEKDALIGELQNKLMYKDAEFINYRRRKDEETQNIVKYASQDLILEILNSIDNFERAIFSTKEDENNKNLMVGIKMIYNELVNTLKKYGVEEIEALNLEFDHNLHNAVMTDENKEIKDNIITEVLQKGYKYKDRIIRPAMVKVNKIN